MKTLSVEYVDRNSITYEGKKLRDGYYKGGIFFILKWYVHG